MSYQYTLLLAGVALPMLAAAQATQGQAQPAPAQLDVSKFNKDAPEGKVYDKTTKKSYRVVQAPEVTRSTAHIENSDRTADTKKTTADGIFNIGKGVKVPFPEGPLDTLHFDHNERDTPNAASKSHLDRLALLLVENPAAEYSIKGYADQSGRVGYNDTLAWDRAKTTGRALLNRANEICELRSLPPIDTARVTVISSFGERAPLVKKTQTDSNDKYERELREEQNRFTGVSLHWNPQVLADQRTQSFLITNESNKNIVFNLTLSESARQTLEAAHKGEHYAVANGRGAILFDAGIDTKKPAIITMGDMTPETDGNVIFAVKDDGTGQTFRFHHDKSGNNNKIKVQACGADNRWGTIAEINQGKGNPEHMQFAVVDDKGNMIPLKLDERGSFQAQVQTMATVDMAKPAPTKIKPNDIPVPFRPATRKEQQAFAAQLNDAVAKGNTGGIGLDWQQGANGKSEASFSPTPAGGNTFPLNPNGAGPSGSGMRK